jgi:hypothetical protein
MLLHFFALSCSGPESSDQPNDKEGEIYRYIEVDRLPLGSDEVNEAVIRIEHSLKTDEF